MADAASFVRANSALFQRLAEDDPACVWHLCLPPGCEESAVLCLADVLTEPLLAARLCCLSSVPLLRSPKNNTVDELHSLHYYADYLQLPVDAVCKKLTLQIASEKLRSRLAGARPLSHQLLNEEELAPYFNRTRFVLDLLLLPSWLCVPLRAKSRLSGLLHGLCGDSLASASCCLADEYRDALAADGRAARAARTLRLRVAWLSGLIIHSWLACRLAADAPGASPPTSGLEVSAGAASAEGGASGGAAAAAAAVAESKPGLSTNYVKVEPSLLRSTWHLSDAEEAAIADGPAFLLSPALIAAYLGRLDWLQALHEADWPLFHSRYQVNCMLFAAAGGHIPVLQWLLGGAASAEVADADAGVPISSRTYAWTPQCARVAARNGHVHVLAWAAERGLMGSPASAHTPVGFSPSPCFAQAALGAAEGASAAALHWLLTSADLSLNAKGVPAVPAGAAPAPPAAAAAGSAASADSAAVVSGTAAADKNDRRVLPWRLPINALNAVADLAATSFDADWGVAEDHDHNHGGSASEEADADGSGDETSEAEDEEAEDEDDEEDDADGPFADGGHGLVEVAAAARGAAPSERLAALHCLVREARCSVTPSALMAAAELGDLSALDFLIAALTGTCADVSAGSAAAAAAVELAGAALSESAGALARVDASVFQGIALAAAANGHATVFQWLADRGVLAGVLSPSVMRAAVGSGSFAVLELLRKSEPPCPWGTGLVALARRKGRADVVAWLRAAGYPATPAEDTHLVM